MGKLLIQNFTFVVISLCLAKGLAQRSSYDTIYCLLLIIRLDMLRTIPFVFSLFLLATTLIHSPASYAQSDAEKALAAQISAHQGKVIYIDFWASWCKPCRKSFPWMNEMKAKYEQDGLVIIAINLDAEQSFADEFLAEVPANFDIIFDAEGRTARKLKIKGMPSSYLINRAGDWVSAHRGFNAEKQLQFEQEIVSLLAQ